jgi:hypothetical protein
LRETVAAAEAEESPLTQFQRKYPFLKDHVDFMNNKLHYLISIELQVEEKKMNPEALNFHLATEFRKSQRMLWKFWNVVFSMKTMKERKPQMYIKKY